MPKTANLNVDVLIDFISGTLPVPGGEEVIDYINHETEERNNLDAINVFIADCHDPDNKDHFSIWPKHALRGTLGQMFHPRLKIPDGSFIVLKGTGKRNNGYSAFDKEDVEIYIKLGRWRLPLSFKTLHDLLVSLEIIRTNVRGLATNFCDKATALDSANLGYMTSIHLNACRGIPFPDDDPRSVKKALEEMEMAGVELVY